jgi:hypothetical protein
MASLLCCHLLDHTIKNFLFSSAKPCDFDGMLGTGLLVPMYTTKTLSDKCRFNVTQLKEFFTFSVRGRYHIIKEFKTFWDYGCDV